MAEYVPWVTSRAAGFVAYLLLALVVLWGLAMRTRLLDRWVSRAVVYALHEQLSLTFLGFVVVHAAALAFDATVPFGLLDMLVPFAASYRPVWTGAGVLAAELATAVVLSSLLRSRLSQRAWSLVHRLSLPAFLMGTAHGLGAGSSAGSWLARATYVLTALAVLGLYGCHVAGRARGPRGDDERAPGRTRARPPVITGSTPSSTRSQG